MRYLLAAAALPLLLSVASAQTTDKVNTIKEAIDRLSSCWRPPADIVTHHVDITVVFAFNRAGELMGQPRITYQAPDIPDPDRQAYKVAVMDTLQRCSPMPFTDTMGAAVAGHPFAVRFMSEPPTFPSRPSEKRAWQPPKIL
jgi:hypothetical protein